MDLKAVIRVSAGFLVFFGMLVMIPAIYSLCTNDSTALSFLYIGGSTCVIGLLAFLLCRSEYEELNIRSGCAVVALSWIMACVIGALPYYLSGTLSSFVDAFFEATSGFTGTGSSVIRSVEHTDRAVLLWRSMTQWLGGMGIIVFFIAILPLLGVGGIHLFKAEAPGPQADKLTPRVQNVAKSLWGIYSGLTLVMIIALISAGLSPFDAVNHAFTTMATGGFSTHSNGIAFFNSPLVDCIFIVFMFLASVNFSLHYSLLTGNPRALLENSELKAYVLIILSCSLLITAGIYGRDYSSLLEAFRRALFEVVDTVSTTGYTHSHYLQWPVYTHVLLIMLMVMGGMSGSSAGGVKCIRFVAALKLVKLELTHVLHPTAFLTVKTDNRSLPEETLRGIWSLIFIYFINFSVATVILTYRGLDIVSASTAVFTALSGVGPAFGSLGPFSNFIALDDPSKLTLSACMLMGRLEFYSVLILFTPWYWQK
ncbi:MAG: TrkH family potassium uptake protein [Candidatus Dadabacteria bacterium]|nr:MAG: TrkH family potassium uptake protein [Candidatus Dadabacteria bacterium]